MNRQRMKELLPVMRAYADGKEIEYRIDVNGGWKNLEEPSWVDSIDYRVAPEPAYISSEANELANMRRLLQEALPFVGWSGAPDGLVDRIDDALRTRRQNLGG